MKISQTLTAEAAIAELAGRIGQRRIDLGFTQAGLAEEAGVSKRTVERLEAGGATQLASLVRLLRPLGLLHRLDTLIPEPVPSPIELLRYQGKRRQRVATRKPPKVKEPAWAWREDTGGHE